MASSKGGDSDGSFTPSDGSDDEERSDGDSDYESDEEEDKSKSLNIQWTGYGKKTPVILFNSDCLTHKKASYRTVGERYHMAYKFGNSETKIVRNVLNAHGFHEVHPNSSDFNLVWTGAHLKPFTLRGLSEFQKINHFPRSYELTRKDRLYKNLQRMQQIKGVKNFDIIPSSFVLPGEYQEFCSSFLKDKGPWIVKPVASSRGRGVFLVNHPDQIPLDENVIVCKYIPNPFLIDGFKFDVRLYVCVTSYDPLTIYLYEEGLTRFATVKYEKSHRHLRNQCMHLTNYSVNKKNDEYVKNDDADVEDYGNKWSLGAMLRYLRSSGKDTAALMMKIEDCVIKTIMSVELPIATACKMFMPFKGNCFELYGFDILVDDSLKPWVLEVNLSPSLACDSPLDLKIKGNMMCDLFSLTGIICHDPMMRTITQSRRNLDVAAKMAARSKLSVYDSEPPPNQKEKQRPQSASSIKKSSESSGRDVSSSTNKSMQGLNSDEIKVLRRIKEEDARKGGWVRIFPTADSWDLYGNFLQFSTTHNLMVHQKLYPERHKSSTTATPNKGSTSAGSRAKSAYIQLANNAIKPTLELATAYAQAIMRTKQYERKLGTSRQRQRRNRRRAQMRKERRKLAQGVVEESGEDNENEEGEEEDEEKPINEENITARRDQDYKPLASASKSETSVYSKSERHDSKNRSDDVIQIVVEKDSHSKTDNRLEKRVGSTLRTDEHHSEGHRHYMDLQDNQEVEVETSSDPPPPPPPPPPEPKYNVVELLHQGHTLTKVQARTAFAMYLVRVQQRLMTDCSSMSPDDVDGLNEQMDLVLRFLKRAAVNLQQSFKVVVPSRKLPLNDRRRILAKQLGDFVHIYNKETEQLKSRKQLERKHTTLRRAESLEGLEEDKFDRFVHIASEAELEEVLTTYTKINKSASIFLGGKTGGETQTGQHVQTTGNSMKHIGATSRAETPLQKRRDSESMENLSAPKTVTGWEDVPKAIHSVPTSSGDLRPHSSTGHTTRTAPVSYNTSSAASYASAVQIYTQKLSSLRPRSASLSGQKTGGQPEKSIRSRPSSAQVSRPSAPSSNFGSTSDLQDGCKPENIKKKDFTPVNLSEQEKELPKGKSSPLQFSKYFANHKKDKDPYNEKVISEALQRLTMRQQARQYSAFNGTSLLPPDSQANSRPSSAIGYYESRHVEHSKAWPIQDGVVQNTETSHIPSQNFEKGNGDVSEHQVHHGKYITMEDHVFKNRPPSGKRTQSAVESRSVNRKQTNVNLNLQNANATFNSFIEEIGPNWQNDVAAAYSQVTGVLPQNYHTPTQTSKQYQILQQQALKQQSKVLLEQSKAKHQAMIAQAYAVQKSLEGRSKGERAESENGGPQMYAPKPPTKPGQRKIVSATNRMPRRMVPEETSLNFNFYSSNKPSVNGGW